MLKFSEDLLYACMHPSVVPPPPKMIYWLCNDLIVHARVGSWQQLRAESGCTQKHQRDKLLNVRRGKAYQGQGVYLVNVPVILVTAVSGKVLIVMSIFLALAHKAILSWCHLKLSHLAPRKRRL